MLWPLPQGLGGTSRDRLREATPFTAPLGPMNGVSLKQGGAIMAIAAAATLLGGLVIDYVEVGGRRSRKAKYLLLGALGLLSAASSGLTYYVVSRGRGEKT